MFITIPILLRKRKNSFGILIHFLMGYLFFSRKDDWNPYLSPLISQLSRLPVMKVSFLTCCELVCLQRWRRGLVYLRIAGPTLSCGGSTDVWRTRSCGLFFISALDFPAGFFLSSTLKAQASLAKLRKNGVISLWAIIAKTQFKKPYLLLPAGSNYKLTTVHRYES